MALLESIPNHFAGGLPSGQRRLASLGNLGERPRGQIIPSLPGWSVNWGTGGFYEDSVFTNYTIVVCIVASVYWKSICLMKRSKELFWFYGT